MSVEIAGLYRSLSLSTHGMSEHGYSKNSDEFFHMGSQCAGYYDPTKPNHRLDLLLGLVPHVREHPVYINSLEGQQEDQTHRRSDRGGNQCEEVSVGSRLDCTVPFDTTVVKTGPSQCSLSSRVRHESAMTFSSPSGTRQEGIPPGQTEPTALVAGDRQEVYGNGVMAAAGESCDLRRGGSVGTDECQPVQSECGSGKETGEISKSEQPQLRAVPRNLPSWVLGEGGAKRKMSDPGARARREWVQFSREHREQRSLSDSQRPALTMEEYECKSDEGELSALDSGYHDDIRSKSSKARYSPMARSSPPVSDSEGSHENVPAVSRIRRRLTPIAYPREEILSPSDDGAHPLVSTQRAKWPLTKHHSVGSIGGTSSHAASSGSVSTNISISDLLDIRSIDAVTDYLSGLGFDDFSNPQLVPDRFIPQHIEHAKPSLMKQQTIAGDMVTEVFHEPSVTPSTNPSPTPPPELPPPVTSTAEVMDLPLGATAETFLSADPHHSPPPSLSLPVADLTPGNSLPYASAHLTQSPLSPFSARAIAVYTDPSISHFDRSKDVLETVLEETASDLSPSPRWHSPRVSIDHSLAELDKLEGKLGAGLAIQMRKRSLPTREGHKASIGSQVESEPESIYFSVTSYDEDIAREREREDVGTPLSLPGSIDDSWVPNRRRRRCVYTPPQGLLTWLNTQQETISEEDLEVENPDDLPWPFSEQVRLRKSLTEIKQAQEAAALSSDEQTRESQNGDSQWSSSLDREDEVGVGNETLVGCCAQDENATQLHASPVRLDRPDRLLSDSTALQQNPPGQCLEVGNGDSVRQKEGNHHHLPELTDTQFTAQSQSLQS